jgi:HK97 family phage major capsid protein
VNKTLKQLREERQVSLDEMTALINVAEAEDRNLTEDEQSTFDATEKNVNDLASRIDRLERSLELAKNNPVSFGTQDIAKTDKDLKRFSFGAVAKAAYTGVLDGIVKEMDAEARLEAPGQLYRGVAVPSIALQTRDALGEQAGIEVGSFVDQLEANSVLAQAGANFYSGLTADRKFPIISSITSSFIGENLDGSTSVAESGAFSSVSLTPNKLISVVGMSAELMQQNPGVEAALQRNMAQAITAQWEKNLLADANAASGPASIFNEATAVVDSTNALTIAQMITCETNVLENNINPASARLAYLFNGSALGVIKGLAGAEYVTGFMDNFQKTFNTYKYYISSNVGNVASGTADQVLFGDFSDVHLGQFGGLSVLFDPYTNAAKGLGRLVVTTLVDGKAARPTQTLMRCTDSNS